MAAEALIVEDAYQRGYADAIADMRKKKSRGGSGRHNNSGYYRTAGAYVSFQ